MPKIKQPPVKSKYVWSAIKGQYINSETGRIISAKTVRNELEKLMKSSGSLMTTITQSLMDGNISIADWQSIMMQTIKTLHIASASAANGGWAQMSRSDWGFTGAKIRNQYKYLKNFAKQIETGAKGLNNQMLIRAKMYGDAGRNTYEAMRTRYQELENGMMEERRVLGEADHCPDCLEYAKLKWQPIGTLPEIGDSVCLTNCHCTKEYRKKVGGRWEYADTEEGWV